jgi:hypothetical protein
MTNDEGTKIKCQLHYPRFRVTHHNPTDQKKIQRTYYHVLDAIILLNKP